MLNLTNFPRVQIFSRTVIVNIYWREIKRAPKDAPLVPSWCSSGSSLLAVWPDNNEGTNRYK